VAQVMGEGDEVHVDRKQHELDRHQQDDHVLAVEKDSHDADGEQHRAENQEMRKRQQTTSLHRRIRARTIPSYSLFSAGMDTSRTRSPRRTRTCFAGSWYLVSLRRRSVSAMAATIATSSSTAASSNGYAYCVYSSRPSAFVLLYPCCACAGSVD